MTESPTSNTAAGKGVADGNAAAADKRHILLIFAGLMVTMLLASLDQMIFSTALPTIVGELNGVNHMLWVTTAYILASTITLPVYGKVGDLIGRKGLFIFAISIFIVGSVIGGLAHDMTWLITGRAVQGLGGGGLLILAQAIIADVVPARERGKYMGIMGAVFAISSVAGPLLGGWFTDGIGWRWAFWMNIPLGLLAIASAVFFLRLPKNTNRNPSIDIAGMTLLAVASTCLVLMTTWGGNTYDWSSPVIIGLIIGALVAGGLFVAVEWRAVEPVMPLHLFKERNFNLVTIVGLIIGIAMFGALAYLPTYLQMVTGANATEAGLLMIPLMAALLITSVASGQLVSRTGRYKALPMIGMVLVAASLYLLSTMTPDMAVWVICSYLAIMGLGLGMSMQILVLIVQNTFPITEVGTATALEQLLPPDRRLAGFRDRWQPVRGQADPAAQRADASRCRLRRERRELPDPGRSAQPAPRHQGRHRQLLQRRADAHLLVHGPTGDRRADPAGLRGREAAGHLHRTRHPARIAGDRRRQLGPDRRRRRGRLRSAEVRHRQPLRARELRRANPIGDSGSAVAKATPKTRALERAANLPSRATTNDRAKKWRIDGLGAGAPALRFQRTHGPGCGAISINTARRVWRRPSIEAVGDDEKGSRGRHPSKSEPRGMSEIGTDWAGNHA